MVIFRSYVSLPEGIYIVLYKYRKVGKAAPVQGCARTHIIQVIGTDLLTCCIESRHISMMLKSQFLTRPNLSIYKICEQIDPCSGYLISCGSLCADSRSCQTMQQRSALFWPRSGS